ncbi:hypothetical protein [Reyranella massiliensis]|uniref:hypothetical protein n=1 Tax=Reyranella massiliensis TaxID=445220 RepID=UPI0002E8266E|nr:hypothetical protein [Reyranella massiliensis]
MSHRNNARLYVGEILSFFGPDMAVAKIETGEPPDDPTGELPRTVRGYEAFAARQTLKKWRGGPGVKLDDVPDPTVPDLWLDTGKVRSPRTTNNYLAAFEGMLEIATKTIDKTSGRRILEVVPEINFHRLPRRIPRPMPDVELQARLSVAPPWTVDAGEMARLFSLRLNEALAVQLHHMDPELQGLRFNAGETKSGNEEVAWGGKAGWRLLQRLARQAHARRTTYLITWPGQSDWQAVLLGRMKPEAATWQRLKHIRTSWRSSAKVAGIKAPHRFHDVRARGITEVARVMPGAAQGAARHQSPQSTDFYIGFASTEIAEAVDKATRRRWKGKIGTPIDPLANAVRLVGIPEGTRAAKSAREGLKRRRKGQ